MEPMMSDMGVDLEDLIAVERGNPESGVDGLRFFGGSDPRGQSLAAGSGSAGEASGGLAQSVRGR